MQNAFQSYEAIDVSSAFEGVALSSLRKLDLWGLKIAPDVLLTFLTSHTDLEDIRLVFASGEEEEAYDELLADITLPAGALPRLKSFRGPGPLRKAIEIARGESMFVNKETEHFAHPEWLTTKSVLLSVCCSRR